MEYTRTAIRHFPVGERLHLVIESSFGAIVVEGRDVDQATVEVALRLHAESGEAADAALDRVLAGMQCTGERLTISTPSLATSHGWFGFGRGPRVSYVLTVPRQTTCQINGRNGEIEVRAIAGPLHIDQRSGGVLVRGIAQDVRVESRSGAVEVMEVGGAVAVTARSGRVLVRGVGGDATVHCHSGRVEVERVAGRLEARSQSGAVAAVEVRGDAALSSQSGSVTLEHGKGRARLRSTSGSLTFRGAVLGDVEAQSTSGAIHLEIDPSYPFFVEAESVSGSVRSEIPPRQEGRPAGAAPRVRLRTVSGSITLRRLLRAEA
jgi:DUF4097 and DUF4098 domain-containing protein YvlB